MRAWLWHAKSTVLRNVPFMLMIYKIIFCFVLFCLWVCALLRLGKGNFYSWVSWRQALKQRLVCSKLVRESSWNPPVEGSGGKQKWAERSWAVMQPQQRPRPAPWNTVKRKWPFRVRPALQRGHVALYSPRKPSVLQAAPKNILGTFRWELKAVFC